MPAELTLSQINGRFKVLDRPAALPGNCTVCGAVDRPVVDFNFDLDFYGAIVICVECMKAAAEILGMVDRESLDRAELVQRAHSDQIMAAKELTDEYYNRIADLLGEFTDRLRSIHEPSAKSDDEVPGQNDAGATTDDNSPDGSDKPVATEKSKPSRNKGSVKLPGSSSNGPTESIFNV